jgi:sulfatase maturation enzyme AslB (radical SAM superfamily)
MKKFSDEKITAKGEKRAWVTLNKLKTLWFNTGTQCNLSCSNCYIESSPTNDRLVYITIDDVTPYLQEITKEEYKTELIAFTGGEPFLNPSMISILDVCLETGIDVLVLTNAYRVLKRHERNLLELKDIYGDKFHLRISLDHYTKKIHERERGDKTFVRTLEQIKWLFDNGFKISIAGRSLLEEDQETALSGYQSLMNEYRIGLNLKELDNIVIFPEMNAGEDVPEITTACWDILSKSPDDQMCASERMIVKRKGAKTPVVLPCTLIAYDEKFELGTTLKEADKDVYLNHPFCAKFCVLGGASCSSAK